MRNAAAAAPPLPTAQAARMEPSFNPASTLANSALWLSGSGVPFLRYSGLSQPIFDPAFLNSPDLTFAAGHTPTAKDTSVGGTCRSSKEPDMLSLPPMAAAPKSSCASSAPSSADRGLPQAAGPVMRSKYSWKVRWTFWVPLPVATSRAMESTTARYAPRHGLRSLITGSKP